MIAKVRPFSLCAPSKIFIPTLSVFIICALLGCAGGPEPKKPAEPMDLGNVLVLPFKDMYKVYGKDFSFRCPLCGSVNEIGEVIEGGDAFLTARLREKLSKLPKLRIVEPGQAVGARSALISESAVEIGEKELILKTAEAVGAQSVMVCRVYRMEERVGTSYSVESPASVAFDILLYRVSDGVLLWYGRFDETQRALNENLFNLGLFIERNARWLTAGQLAESGLDQVMKTFPEPL